MTKKKQAKQPSKQQELEILEEEDTQVSETQDVEEQKPDQRLATLVEYHGKKTPGHAFEVRWDDDKYNNDKKQYVFVEDRLRVHTDYLITVDLVKEDDNNIAYNVTEYAMISDDPDGLGPVVTEEEQEKINENNAVEYVEAKPSAQPPSEEVNIDEKTSVVAIEGERVTYQQNSPALSGETPLSVTYDDVKEYIAGTMSVKPTEEEIKLFVQFCLSNRLDPFANDAYLIKYNKNSQASFQVSKDLYLKRADEHSDYRGYESGIIVFNPQTNQIEEREGTFWLKRRGEQLLGAWAVIYRQGMIPFRKKVSFHEYDQGRNLWNTKPATMIEKVAVAQALRAAFPNSLAGLYFEEEMDKN